MNLPQVVTDLIQAQNNFDSDAYANCFADTGIMFDEGKPIQEESRSNV